MYVQVNQTEYIPEGKDTVYWGEVYDFNNKKICDFKWSAQGGTLWTNPDVESTNIDFFIDDRCSAMLNDEEEYDEEDEEEEY